MPLYVVEGVDGAGKSIQIELLKFKLDFLLFKYPTRKTPELNDYLEKKIEMDEHELFHLFLKDIMAEQQEIRKALEDGKTVILDRYVFSTVAYEKKGVSYEEGKKIIENMNFLKPDKVFLLDIVPELSQERKRKQKSLDRYESDLAYLGKVRSNFHRLYYEKFLCNNWYLIDGSKDKETVHQQIMKILL